MEQAWKFPGIGHRTDAPVKTVLLVPVVFMNYIQFKEAPGVILMLLPTFRAYYD